MMKIILLLSSIFWITSAVKAEYVENTVFDARINDKDGYTNVRINPRADAKVIGKFTSNQRFYADPRTRTATIEQEWLAVTDGQSIFGFIHKSRVKLLDKTPDVFMKYGGKAGWELDNLPFKPIAIFIKTKDFEKSRHNIVCYPESESKCTVSTIDGRRPYGLDTDLPRNGVDSIVVFSEGKGYPVSPEIYSDLYEVKFTAKANSIGNTIPVKAWRSQDGNKILVVMDAGIISFGKYEATIIVDRKGEAYRFIGKGYGHGAPL